MIQPGIESQECRLDAPASFAGILPSPRKYWVGVKFGRWLNLCVYAAPAVSAAPDAC